MSENISSNNIYQTQIPSLTEAADIQDAFKLYHFGSTTEPASASVSAGIAKHLYDLQTLKAPIAGPTFTGTLTAPTINASTALQIGGVAITSTPAELNLISGSSAGTIVNSKALIYGAAGQVNATTLQIAGISVLAAATPLPGTYGGTGVNNGTKTITLGANLTTSGANNVTLTTSGATNVTLPTSGTLVASGAIVNADINASAGIVDTKLATISTANKVSIAALDIDGGTDIGTDIVDADLLIIDDGGAGTNRKTAVTRIPTYVFTKISGDVSINSSGVATVTGASATDINIVTTDGNTSDTTMYPVLVGANITGSQSTHIDGAGLSYTASTNELTATTFAGALSGNASTAAKWASAVNLAGNSVDGSTAVPFTNKFIVQGTTDAGLTGAQFLGSLATGIVKNTTTTGVLSIATSADLPTPMTTLGDFTYGGASGVRTRLSGPSTNGTYVMTSIPTAGAAVAPTWSLASGLTVSTATGATNINISTTDGNTSDTLMYPVLVGGGVTGNQLPHIDTSGLSYNASTNVLTTTATQATSAALYVTTGTDTGFDYRRIFVGPTAPDNATHTLQIGDVWIDV